MAGKIYRYLADDHTRLEELLERVVTLPHGVKAEKITAPLGCDRNSKQHRYTQN